jgi:hypothetical protein
MEWITFRGHSVAEFHKRLRTVARKYNPHFMISGNVFGGFGYGPIAYDGAGNIEMLGRDGYDDFIYSEMQEYLDSAPRKNKDGVKITNSPALKFLAAASHGKPVIVYATEITPPIFPDPTEKCLSAMAQINIAEAVANHAIFREKRQTPPGATQMYTFLASQRHKLSGAHLYSNIAVLASLNQYLANEQSFAFSSSRVLADRGISHVMIVEDDLLKADLTDYDLIYIPYMPLLSIEKQNALIKYAENGGKLLILGKSGIKNQYNLSQEQVVLADVLGKKSYPDNKLVTAVGKGKICYLPLSIPKSKFLISAKEGKNVTTFGPSMADVFADIPEGYTRGRIDPELKKVLRTAADQIEELLAGEMTYLQNATPFLELTTMMQKEKDLILVHIVNYDVILDGTITPAEHFKVVISLPEGKTVKNIMYGGNLSQMEKATYSKSGKLITIDIPKIEIYGLGVVELE